MNKFRDDMTPNELHLREVMDAVWEAKSGREGNAIALDTAYNLLHGIATDLAWHGETSNCAKYAARTLDKARPADARTETERFLDHASKQARAKASHHLLDGSEKYTDYRDAAEMIERIKAQLSDDVAA